METCSQLYGTFLSSLMQDCLRTFSHLGVLSDGFYSKSFSDAQDDIASVIQKWVAEPRDEVTLREEILASSIFGKSLERAVIEGLPFCFYAECNRARGWIPGSLAQLACELLFNVDGTLRTDVDSYIQAFSFRYLRQLSLAFSKVETIEPVVGDEITGFVHRVMRSPDLYAMYANPFLEFRKVITVARMLLRDVLMDGSEMTASLHQWNESPFGRHGPGAVQGGEVGREKWRLSLNPRVPTGIYEGQTGMLSSIMPDNGDELMSRLCLVPKDIKRNRLICIEPKELMFAQQGLMKVLIELIERHPLTRESICFHDQSYQFWLSRRKGKATIDLEDASDLVSIKLLKLLLPKKVAALLLRYRSSAIELPDGHVLRAHQTAFTMGNALCFPVETLIFWALSTAACVVDDARVYDLDARRVVNLQASADRYRCHVFGDDIIIPERYFEAVIVALHQAGLVVNRKKSCGPLTRVRESCGSYWWDNHDVRIVRFTTHRCDDPNHAYIVWKYCQTFASYGFENVAAALLGLVKDVIPNCEFDPVSIRVGLGNGSMRWNRTLQRLEAKVPVPKGIDKREVLSGDIGLYAYFTQQATHPVLTRGVQCTKLRWVPISELPRI